MLKQFKEAWEGDLQVAGYEAFLFKGSLLSNTWHISSVFIGILLAPDLRQSKAPLLFKLKNANYFIPI